MAAAIQKGRANSKAINAAIEDAERLDTSTVAALPAAALHTGKLRYVTNGAAGSPCLAYSNGTSWLRILIGAAVSATV